MENEKFNKQPKLLGVHFKKIGIVVMVLSILPGLIIKTMHITLMESQKDLFKSLSYSIFLMGLLLMNLPSLEKKMRKEIKIKTKFVLFVEKD